MQLCLFSVLVFLSSCEDRSNPWPAIAKADLDFIKLMVEQNHPGYVDPENPQFKPQLEQHYKNVINQLQYVGSLDAVLNLDNEFIASFADYHVSIAPRFVSNYQAWTGIKLERRNEKYQVTRLAEEWPVSLPAIGNELVSCDERAVNDIMNYDILRYRYANYEAKYPRVKYASKLLIDDGVGYRKRAEKCVFRDDAGKETTFTLQWRAIGNHLTAEWDSSIVKPDAFSIDALNESVIWVRIPTFQQEVAEQEKLEALLKSLTDLGAASDKTIVFDVRGNGGGYLGMSTAFLRSVYGAPVLLALFSKEVGENNTLLRASPRYLDNVKKAASIDGGKRSAEQREYDSIRTSALEQALAQGISLVKEPLRNIDLNIADKRPIEDIQYSLPRLVVFTDHFCASECLMFVSMVLHEPKNLHVGEITYADSAYSLIYSQYPFELPSKLGSINLPLAIFGQKGPFIPSIKFEGDINDTHAIKDWFMSLHLPNAQ
jgi:hypothetical protein